MQDKQTAPASLKTAKGQPLYRQLADALRAEITAGRHPVGSLLPTEQELCDRFETSRYTVREALRLLTEDGLVERRQGRGTQVISDRQRPVYAQWLTSLSQLYAYAEDTVLTVDSVEATVPDEALAVQLGRAPGRPWLRAEGTRRGQDGAVICVSRIYINTEFADIAEQLHSLSGALHVAITERFGVETDQVQQHIRLDPAAPEIATPLGLTPGEWTVAVRRRYLAADDKPILVSLNWHRAAEFSYSQIIRRD